MVRNANKIWHSPATSEKRRSFRVGSEVEVRSNNDGFQGAWFEAVVTKGLSKHRRYGVTYTTLVADESSKDPLTDAVYCAFVRPRPQPRDPSEVFEVHQCVEAFHNEGWWRGVVSELPKEGGDGSYAVCFPTTREEFRFEAEKLRRQMEWVSGKWVPVEETQDVECAIFGEGTRVEVSRDREHFGAAWFAGTVLRVIGKTYFLVEYENLRVNNNHTEILLKEIIDMQYIRPCPPSLESSRFKVLDEVEGFHQDGWFVGIVSMILSRSRYKVKYKHRKEEVLLDHTSLRPCRVWADGHWVHSSRHRKRQTPRETKSAVPRWSSSASKRTSHPISLLTTSDDVDVAEGSTLSNLKRRIADGPNHGLVESSLTSKKSKKKKLSEQRLQLLNDMSQDKRDNMSIPVPNFIDNGGKIADSTEAMNLNGKDAVGPSLEGGVELSQPCKKLKKGNVLGEHLQLDDEIQSVIMEPRSNALKQIRLPIPVLTSSNDDGKVAAISGVLNSKDNLSQTSKKPENGKSLEEHLQSIDGMLKGCPTCLGEGTECQPKEVNFKHSPVANKDAEFVPIAYCGDGKGNPSPTVNTGKRRKKLVVRTPKRPVKASNVVDMKHPVPEEIKEHMGAIPPKTVMNSMESKQLSENDKALENTNSVPTISTEENSLGNEYTSLSDKQVDVMEDAHAVPRIESSILNAESLEYEVVVRQSQELKSFLGSWSCTNRLAETGAEAQHQALPSISNGLPSDNVVEMALNDSAPTGSSPSEDINVCDENEFSPSRLLAENAFVEAEDRTPLDPSPSGSSLSREDVADRNEVPPHRSLSGRPVIEMEQVPWDPTPCRSSPSNAICHDQEKLVESVMSSVMSCSLINKCGEIRSCIDELGENGRRKNQALPVGFEKDIAPEGDKLASTGPKTGQDIFKDGEMALLGPAPMEVPFENSVLPFTKRSEFWDFVETKEAFRLLPQQPHFRPLLKYGKEFREGMAIGLMVSFAHLVTDLSSLRIGDSHQEFEEKLKALGPFEENGFNIQPVRDRLEKLLELHGTLTQSEGKKQLLGEKVAKLEKEKCQNGLLMFSVETCMSVLEQNLARLKERRASALLDIRKNDSELANLQGDVQAAEEASVSAERQFSTALTGPW